MRVVIPERARISGISLPVIIIASACYIQPPPPDQYLLTWVTNSAEFSTDQDSWQILNSKINDIIESTNKAFGQVARIEFRFPIAPLTTILSHGGQGWPIIDKNDSNYNNNGSAERFYAAFIQANRNTNYAFGVFWVMGPSSSFPICGTQPKVLGFNYDATFGVDNQVSGVVTNRGTFIFTGWVDGVTKCQWYGAAGYPAINLYIRVHTHELGHQRGDLTHSDAVYSFHTGAVPAAYSRLDVMHSNALTTDLRTKIPVFDQHFDPVSESTLCVTLTCQDNLVCWRMITN